MCLVFQPGTIQRFTVDAPKPGGNPDDGPPIRVNAQVAIANWSRRQETCTRQLKIVWSHHRPLSMQTLSSGSGPV